MFKKIEDKKININGEDYPFTLRRKRFAKYVRLTIEHDGRLMVTAPVTYPVFLVKKFLLSRAKWLVRNLTKIKENPNIFSIKHSSQDIKKYKEQTRMFVLDRLNYFNQFYNFEYKRISIRDQKSRWGSCSSQKNLNYNYRLCLLPQELAEYIVVHELCHIQEMNHSSRFWQLVAQTIPDYKLRQKKLKSI